MTTITNSYHHSSANIRANVGESVSCATQARVWRQLCGDDNCTCGDDVGARGSRYTIDHGIVVDRKPADSPLTLAEARAMYGNDGFGR